ncbi:MAG TPA: tRNA uridine-5-carboxymethylaminomethyl(34) synthesis GTPase MnmE [Thermodesulfobacteriota bacterium]|nr:tRNA uridine-5-carboxymethylaminomethyl(34) synthesis GTPase MnmE [Thermodesulfobacteriota bacterium]
MGSSFTPNDDTIAAIATPPGDGGIAVIRISGPESLDIIRAIFEAGGEEAPGFTPRTLYHGHITDPESGALIDEVLAVYMKSPASYTGEDVVEIHSHGGHIVPKKIMDLVFGQGARPANPGEFSLRAFLNGKMDLAQAEAVADVINARTGDALKQAELQLEGVLSHKIQEIKDIILDILAEVEAQVDFPEEDIDPIVKSALIARTEDILAGLGALLSTYNEGRILKHGVSIAIIGKPNVGKSSLLNRLVMKERAIVSPVPGTTRDFIEESIDVRGLPLRLVDTAGIRATGDEIERAGVDLAKKKASEAELIICVIDGSAPLDEDDNEVLSSLEGKQAVLAVNKADAGLKVSDSELRGFCAPGKTVHTSAKAGTGIEDLKEAINGLLRGNAKRGEAEEIVLTELRHKLAIEKAAEGLSSFLKLLDAGESPEFLALDLRVALDSLGEITGEVTTEDVLGRIFSKFCVGK